jgi:hypothetical protein
MKLVFSIACFLLMALTLQTSVAKGQVYPVTIQGSLKDGAVPANGSYDVECSFFSVPAGGVALGTRTFNATPVTNGIFTLTGDFGQIFPSPVVDQWVEFRVKPAGAPGPMTVLAPRQRVAFAPLAVSSISSENSTRLNGMLSSQFVQGNDPRLTDGRNPLPGSTNYIQNTDVPQANASFNIGGNGTVAGTFSALSVTATGGVTAQNVDVSSPSGYRIGGVVALYMTSNGTTAVGNQAGLFNSGSGNSFFGQTAGRQSSVGTSNSFFGAGAGYLNEGGNENSFFGYLTGNNSQGNRNSFFGHRAGLGNGAGNSNTLVGYNSATAGVLTNATALGAYSQVNQSNSLILGSINGVNGAAADTNVGIGTTTPANKLHVNGSVRVTNGFVFITNPNTVIITSPNGACWGITVNNSGGLATFPVNPCP